MTQWSPYSTVTFTEQPITWFFRVHYPVCWLSCLFNSSAICRLFCRSCTKSRACLCPNAWYPSGDRCERWCEQIRTKMRDRLAYSPRVWVDLSEMELSSRLNVRLGQCILWSVCVQDAARLVKDNSTQSRNREHLSQDMVITSGGVCTSRPLEYNSSIGLNYIMTPWIMLI